MKEEALKLADELRHCADGGYNQDASAMIRRLVEELDKHQVAWNMMEALYSGALKVAESIPQTKKSEPVVYWDGKHFASKEKSSLADIPLYTTPQTKPLSDEEITAIYTKLNNQVDRPIFVLDFARAIEAKVRGKK